MNNVFISAVTGNDSSGIIKSLAETTRELGGVWVTSKVMKLDGQFIALMKVRVKPEEENDLVAALKAKYPELLFTHSEARPAPDRPAKQLKLELDCKDRSGLTKDINNTLSNLDLVVNHMEFHRLLVTTLGETVYNAKLDLTVPADTDNADLASEIEAMLTADDVRVHVMA